MDSPLTTDRGPITRAMREEVLLQVREHPEIYDKVHPNYRDPVTVKRAWDNIARAAGFFGKKTQGLFWRPLKEINFFVVFVSFLKMERRRRRFGGAWRTRDVSTFARRWQAVHASFNAGTSHVSCNSWTCMTTPTPRKLTSCYLCRVKTKKPRIHYRSHCEIKLSRRSKLCVESCCAQVLVGIDQRSGPLAARFYTVRGRHNLHSTSQRLVETMFFVQLRLSRCKGFNRETC